MKNQFVSLAATAMLSLGSAVALHPPAQAVQLRGTTYFASPPRLVGSESTQKYVYAWGAIYFFTLQVPENAGEPLQRVTIAQQSSPDYVRFDLNRTEAFEGGGRSGPKIPLGSVTYDDKTHAVTATFNPPIQPGRTVTIALRPYQNPSVGGVYLYGVTAFPGSGEPAYGQFLGFGRFNIYESGPNSFFFRRFR